MPSEFDDIIDKGQKLKKTREILKEQIEAKKKTVQTKLQKLQKLNEVQKINSVPTSPRPTTPPPISSRPTTPKEKRVGDVRKEAAAAERALAAEAAAIKVQRITRGHLSRNEVKEALRRANELRTAAQSQQQPPQQQQPQPSAPTTTPPLPQQQPSKPPLPPPPPIAAPLQILRQPDNIVNNSAAAVAATTTDAAPATTTTAPATTDAAPATTTTAATAAATATTTTAAATSTHENNDRLELKKSIIEIKEGKDSFLELIIVKRPEKFMLWKDTYFETLLSEYTNQKENIEQLFEPILTNINKKSYGLEKIRNEFLAFLQELKIFLTKALEFFLVSILYKTQETHVAPEKKNFYVYQNSLEILRTLSENKNNSKTYAFLTFMNEIDKVHDFQSVNNSLTLLPFSSIGK